MTMVIWKHELKTGLLSLIIWSCAISFLLGVCVLIYPEMAGQMGQISETFSQMGGFTQAFGMDKLNFGEFTGFFGVECGNVLGLGGALFAALTGISVLSKEEKDHTAEFLLAHPVGRLTIVAQKLCAVYSQIFILNVVCVCITAICIAVIGESPDVKTMALLFLAYFLMQLEGASICFGLSAFLRKGGMGLGLGLAVVCYFLNIIANLAENVRFLKYITPFGYTEGADIIANGMIEGKYAAVGMLFVIVFVCMAFYRYAGKDIC